MVMNRVLETCSEAVLDFAQNGISHAMNHYNKPVK